MGWEIVSDLMSSLEEWLKGKLADGIVGCLQSTCDTLSNTFSSDNKGMMKMFLKDRPEEFTGVTSGGTPIWSGIETITNNAIVPIAMFVLVVVLLYELIQMVISGNNFREFDMGIFFKWSVKALCGILLISNVFYIATNVFLFGSSAVNEGLSTLFSGAFFTSGDPHLSGTLRSKLMTLEVGTLLILLLLACLIAIVAFVVLGAIIVVLSSRMIEIFMYLSISPIPMATMMNNDWGQIGKNWLRNILALAFQGFFIVVALTIFRVILSNVITQMASIGTGSTVTSGAITGSMAMLLGYVIALIFTIFRSSQISKSVFSAQ